MKLQYLDCYYRLEIFVQLKLTPNNLDPVEAFLKTGRGILSVSNNVFHPCRSPTFTLHLLSANPLSLDLSGILLAGKELRVR